LRGSDQPADLMIGGAISSNRSADFLSCSESS
jgi:hypothetical protein